MLLMSGFVKFQRHILKGLVALVFFLIALVILAISLIAANHKQSTGTDKLFSQTKTSPIVAEVKPQEPEKYLVDRVIDGDTIKLNNGITVRYIGINAPEMTTKCFAREATDYNRQLVEGQVVALEKDISDTDKYNRLLRYVYLENVMINEKLVAEGYAQVATYPPDVKYVDKFLAAQKSAKASNLGLWAKCLKEEAK